MALHAPSLNAVRMFAVAARHLSFVRAADELHLTHGAVSRQIKLLEETLGVALFERRNRAVFLTREGAAFKLTCDDVMARLAEGVRAIQQAAPQRPLVLSCEPTLAMRWLIPRLGAFRATFPQIELHLFAAGGPVQFQRGHVDLALRRNDFAWGAGCHAEPVAREWTAPVCAPALLQGGQLHLERQGLLHTQSRPDAWQRWGAASGRPVAAATAARYEHFYLSLQAAGAGLGVAIGSVYMVEEELASARLVAPPGGFVEDGSVYFLLSPTPFEGDERRQTVLGWLRRELAATLAAVVR
ncbi:MULTISPECIES: LysR substrate-binding domain-containing protein [unclassified Janthinobacterium]|uniref:LysR substrate-binding domain-containing protein n=1 Tax=unclassified Janthinobacterium TaxID=2610881 RepID=UPI00034D8B65|nr:MULTISPECIES: LysR substrate-binding domain-containing protein [unclassified Janthinobacterium]MEC5160417.1 LysR family glycine cleavage system transcriptional activator [Janthinobacterium sp. CG_S6]